MVGAAEMNAGSERVMECSIIDGEVIRLILRPELPFYPDQAIVRASGKTVEIELREGRQRISFLITEAELDNPLAIMKGTVVNLVEFPIDDPLPSRDTLIEIA